MSKASLKGFCEEHEWEIAVWQQADTPPEKITFRKGNCEVSMKPDNEIQIHIIPLVIQEEFDYKLDSLENLVEEAHIIYDWLCYSSFEEVKKGVT